MSWPAPMRWTIAVLAMPVLVLALGGCGPKGGHNGKRVVTMSGGEGCGAPDSHSHQVGDHCECDDGFEWCDYDDDDDYTCCELEGGGDGDGDGTSAGDGDGDGDGDGACPPHEHYKCGIPVDCNEPGVDCGGIQSLWDGLGCPRPRCGGPNLDECPDGFVCYQPSADGGCLSSSSSCEWEEGECMCGATDDCEGSFCLDEELVP